jgi:hypothetical protein
MLAVLIVAGVVFWGINARIQTAAAVKETTRELAIPTSPSSIPSRAP